MPPHKVKIIVNPNADLGRAWRVAGDLRHLVDEFGGADWSGTVYPSHAIELARQAAETGYETVIAAGGDGTVHEVINGLMQAPADHRPRLGIVPLGSGNDFSHAMGILPNAPAALKQVFQGKPRLMDIGEMRDDSGRVEYVCNTLGLGFDATVTIRSRRFTMLRGFLVYLLAVLQTIILNHEAAHIKVTSDAEDWEDDLLMLVLCNGPREGGGFAIAPQALIDDGVFHYAAVNRVSRPMMLRLLPEVIRGTHGRFSCVRMGTFRKMELISDHPLVMHIDGEIITGFGTNVRKLSLEVFPGALEVMV